MDVAARLLNLRNQALEVLQLLPQTPAELVNAVQSVPSAAALADLIASFMDITPQEKEEILETVDIERRLERVSELLAYRIEVLRLSRQISEQTKGKIDDRQREFLLREQMRTIQKELGEGEDAKAQEIAELTKKIAEAKMPPEVEEHVKRELARLDRMPEASGEYSMARTYLEWLTELPWSVESGKPVDIAEARRILDADHYGLRKIKRRILEYLAIQQLNPGGRSPILCFVGPPGVGKTSLGQSIARATGRKFVRGQSRRHPRRGRDPRAPPHLYRGVAGEHHPGDPPRRRAGLRDDARRDRQARPRHPGRPFLRPPRGARPRAELDFPRQLSRRAVRPLEGHVHHDGERPRQHPGAVARPHGGHRPARLCRGRKVRDRPPLSRRPAAQGQRIDRRAGRDHRRGDPRDHPRLHSRSRRAPARAGNRSGVAQRRDAALPRAPRSTFGSSRRT